MLRFEADQIIDAMLPLTIPILRLLSDAEFHSGEVLAQRLNVSRASVCNALHNVAELGIELYKVRGRGYQMPLPIDWLERDRVLPHLGEQAEAIRLTLRDVVDSTNTQLLNSVALAETHGQCLAAEIQTQGRGRRGRVWQGMLGGSLTFSLAWQFNLGVAQLSGLSLAVGVAIARALQTLGITQLQLKWPNDLLHSYHKLGGVLIEVQGDALGPSATVIGVGLNYRLSTQAKHLIDQAAIDLFSLKTDIHSRNQVLGVVLRHLAEALSVFERAGFSAFREEWLSLHAYQGKPIALRLPDGSEVLGVLRDVSEDGMLVLETSNGEKRFGSGEISMRPRSPVMRSHSA